MKKCMALFLCICLVLSLFGCSEEDTSKKEITVLCCVEYVPDKVAQQFYEKTGVRVKIETASDDDDVAQKIKNNPEKYDLVIASDYAMNELRKLNLLQPLKKEKIKNFKNVNSIYRNYYYDPQNELTVPLNVSALVIVYNKKTCPIKIDGFEDLFNPALKNQISFLNNANAIISICNAVNNSDLNSMENLNGVETMLETLAQNTQSLSDSTPQDAIISGDASVGVMLNVSAGTALAKNKNCEMVYPKEGFMMLTDSIACCGFDEPNSSAFSFIDFLLTPDVISGVIENINGCPTVSAAIPKMSSAYATNKGYILNPNEMKNGKFFHKLLPGVQTDFDIIYFKVFRTHLEAIETVPDE
ncbi:MAG: extracellular solute-binding protein [Clostridia bacterium]|nr:extracellular solute-binding protein [Clostridia bacterium]